MTVQKRDDSIESLLLFQRLPWIMPPIYSCPKFHHFSYGERSHTARAFHLRLNFELLDSSQCLHVDNFSGYDVVFPIWSPNTSSNIMTLETHLCHVFRFLDHLWSDSCVPSIAKVTQQRTVVKIFAVPYMRPTINNITCYWALKRLLHCGFDLHFPGG